MKSSQKGFTIIELMFVVGIVGVLAAIALPVYFDYSARAKVSEGFALADRAKTGVTETYLMSGEWKDTNSEYGLADPEQISGTYVARIDAVQDTVTMTYRNVGNRVPDGSTVMLTGTPTGGSVKWKCSSTTVKSKYLPASCR